MLPLSALFRLRCPYIFSTSRFSLYFFFSPVLRILAQCFGMDPERLFCVTTFESFRFFAFLYRRCTVFLFPSSPAKHKMSPNLRFQGTYFLERLKIVILRSVNVGLMDVHIKKKFMSFGISSSSFPLCTRQYLRSKPSLSMLYYLALVLFYHP